MQTLNHTPKVRWVAPREVTRYEADGSVVTVILDRRQRQELSRAHRREMDLIKFEEKQKRAVERAAKKAERERVREEAATK